MTPTRKSHWEDKPTCYNPVYCSVHEASLIRTIYLAEFSGWIKFCENEVIGKRASNMEFQM